MKFYWNVHNLIRKSGLIHFNYYNISNMLKISKNKQILELSYYVTLECACTILWRNGVFKTLCQLEQNKKRNRFENGGIYFVKLS